MTDVCLEGCRAEPLSSYLTALAVLRLVSEQKDPNARGWWEKGVFHLDSCLDKRGLVDFFLNEYIPTPIVSPWNGGSGFGEGDVNEGMRIISDSDCGRLTRYRQTIEAVQSFPEMPTFNHPVSTLLRLLQKEADKSKGKKKDGYVDLIQSTRSLAALVPNLSPDEDLLALKLVELEKRTNETKNLTAEGNEQIQAIKKLIASIKKVRNAFKSIERSAGKEQIILACRDRLTEDAVEWIDAAAIIDPEGNRQFPALLGTGGNDGRLEFSKIYMNNISFLLIEKPEISEDLLNNALYNELTDELQTSSVGQYDPGRSGGFNQGAEIETKDFPINPWSYIFTLEGTIPWASSVAKRNLSAGKGSLRSPFTVRSTPVGYTSSADTDSTTARAEIWAPLWYRPANYNEIRALLSEGRADVGRYPASNGIEFAEAVMSYGIDRGISEFIRYTLLQRRGKSYVALPAGRFPVQYRSEADLVRELTHLLKKIYMQGDGTPARFSMARRNVDEAIYNLLLHGGTLYVKNLLAAIGRLEKIIAQSAYGGKPSALRPITGLSPRWISAADDGSIELRIATALASIGATGSVGPIRANLAPVDPAQPWKWKEGRGQTAWEGNSFAARLSSILVRRMMDADRLGTKNNPLWGAIQIHPQDICAFIEGRVDESLIEDLLFGMTWIRWNDSDLSTVRKDLMEKNQWNKPVSQSPVSRHYALLKLLFLPGGLMKGDERILIKPEPSIVPLLRANRIGEACTIAGRRLRITGFIPLTTAFQGGDDGLRIAAALLIPMRNEQQIKNLVLKSQEIKK